MKVRAPANKQLRRARLVLILAALVPTVLAVPVGIILLAGGGANALTIVAGVLVLAFCASAIVAFILGSIWLRRSAKLIELQNDFLASVSHELRTPMTSMRMFVEALRDERLDDTPTRDRCLESIQRELVRLDQLVGRLIDLSRIELDPHHLTDESIPAAELVAAAVNAFDAQHLAEPVTVQRTVEPGLHVRGDRIALTQVLVNLMSNADKHGTDDPSPIRIEARADGDRHVLFTVEDAGPGVPAAERTSIFGAFCRGADASLPKPEGSGLGLTIVRAIVERHEGTVEVDSSENLGGAAFRVRLRRAAAQPADLAAPQKTASVTP